VQTRIDTLEEEEEFNIDAISGGEDDDEPPCGDHGRDANSTAQGGDSPCRNQVNDPDIAALPKHAANDIHYFFDNYKSSKGPVVCKICRQVFLCPQLF
jgi:hypothetical protein